MSSEIVVVKTPFFIGNRKYRKGETFHRDDPRIEGHKVNFEAFKVDNELEQATAAPGEKRSARKMTSDSPEPEKPEPPKGK